MPSAFTITIILIAVTTIIGALLKGRSKDSCLVDFDDYPVTLEMKDGKRVWGRLGVASAGLEFFYNSDHLDTEGHIEKNYILYKPEYTNIDILVRYHDSLDENQMKKRDGALTRYYEPKAIHRLGRRMRNIYYTIRDAIVEVIALLIGRIRAVTPAGTALAGQDKYVSSIQQQIIPPVSSAFEPLLEKYISRKVILDVVRGDAKVEYPGILKDYTADFVEVLDVEYKSTQDARQRKADLIIPRQAGVVRHLGA